MSRYAEWGIPVDKMRYVENGHVAGDRAPPGTPPPRRNAFAYFGQVSPFKGLDVFLDAARLVDEAGVRDFRIEVHGTMDFLSTEQTDLIRQKLQALGGRVRVHGRYRPEDAVELMATVDWIVVPSVWWENAPLVIQEAFAARRPVICSNIGGMAEKVRDGVDGLHFRVGDPADLAAVMIRACRDGRLQRRLAANARPVHSMTQSAREHLALYGSSVAADEAAARP